MHLSVVNVNIHSLAHIMFISAYSYIHTHTHSHTHTRIHGHMPTEQTVTVEGQFGAGNAIGQGPTRGRFKDW